MRDISLRCSVDRGSCQCYHLSLVFCECLQVIIHKGDAGLAYKISPMYRESHPRKSKPLAMRPMNVLSDVQ